MARNQTEDPESGDDSGMDQEEQGNSSKPGRKKNPNSQAARRDQNRIAQREFRLRKQQRIRDLEARVELLSGNQDETFNYMRLIVKDLIAENSTLRGLVKNLSQFIGEGLPSFLPRMGWDMGEFQEFLNKTDTDTAIESFHNLKRQAVASGNHKRPADDDQGAANKRAKTASSSFAAPSSRSSFSGSGLPLSPSRSAAPRGSSGADLFSNSSDALSFSALFDMPYSTSQSPLIIPAAQPAQPSVNFGAAPAAAPSSQRDLFSGGLPSLDLRPRSQVAGLPTLESSSLGLSNGPPPSLPSSGQQTFPETSISEDDPRKQEAFKLIHYHLENYRRNPQYHLPPSLRPSLIQRTIPHDTVIDGIPLPELRDRMILFKGRYDLAGCVFAFGTMSIVHGDDVLSQSNWELGRSWLQQYGFLVDQGILNITNRWRAERGENDILMSDLGISEPPYGAEA